jgi:hypothetical protein
MGHTRLGKIPKSKAWKDVVGVFAGADPGAHQTNFGHEVARIAGKAMEAAAGAVAAARRDDGVSHVFYLLTQIALAARRPDMDEALHRLGIQLHPIDPSSVDLTVEVHRVLDEHFLDLGGKSDVAEMAQLALGEALSAFLRALPRDMFATAPMQLRRDLHQLGTQRNFGNVSRQFFGNLIGRLLGFYLSRIVHPGDGQCLIGELGDLSRFNDELRKHSNQRALVVHQFATKWFSKTEFEKGIGPKNARRFVSYALKKIEEEFKRGAHGE